MTTTTAHVADPLNPTLDEARAVVAELVNDFASNEKYYLAPTYQEAEVRKDFIDKFLVALGWDVNHVHQRDPFRQEVKVERNVQTATAQRRADYSLALDPHFDSPVLYIEAKKPAGDIATPDNYFQVIRYANQRGHAVGILTDFEQLHVIDCRYRAKIDTAITFAVEKFHYKDFLDPDKFARIYHLLSRPAIIGGALGRYADTLKKSKGRGGQKALFSQAYKPIDERLLETLDELRQTLARGLKNRNPRLDSAALTELTQRVLDRLVFIRFLEDKQIEPDPIIPALGDKPGSIAWHDFISESRRLDKTYNGVVFKYHALLDDPKALDIDEKTFSDILNAFDFHHSEYLFNEIPLHILGSIYERFLGNVIVATEKRATLEPKPEVRKAGGVYYTPKYVVDYVVENSVGKMIDGKTPAEISKMRFADIACGSGSFLLGVYDCLLRHIGRWYNLNPSKAPKSAVLKRNGVLYLSLEEKARILTENIYGVDIDPQAVEVAQLSLYLKLLEEETTASARQYVMEFHRPLLPSLANNIKCGNSLVGSDFNHNRQLKIGEAAAPDKVNAFDWDVEFQSVLKSGGFDAIVGNPPYVRQESLKEFKAYLNAKYKSYQSTADLYVYFLEKCLNLLKPGGRYSCIVSSGFLRTAFGAPFRQHAIENFALLEVVDFGGLPVFADAKDTYVCIPTLARSAAPAEVRVCKLADNPGAELPDYVEKLAYTVPMSRFSRDAWVTNPEPQTKVFEKLVASGEPLGKVIEGRIYRGIITGLNEAFEIDGATVDAMKKKCPTTASIIHPFLGGQDVRRYCSRDTGRFLIAIPDGWTRAAMASAGASVGSLNERNAWKWLTNELPPIAEHLAPFMDAARKRQDKGEFWWELRPCDYYDALDKPKIIYPDITKHARFYLDANGTYISNTAYALGTGDPFLLGVLNSRLNWFVIGQISIPFGTRAGEYRYRMFTQYVERLPMRMLDPKSREDKARRNEIVALVSEASNLYAQSECGTALTDHARTLLERKIAATDRRIDQLVYELYGLTDAEIKVIEDATP